MRSEMVFIKCNPTLPRKVLQSPSKFTPNDFNLRYVLSSEEKSFFSYGCLTVMHGEANIGLSGTRTDTLHE
jgi:hypothetical protein